MTKILISLLICPIVSFAQVKLDGKIIDAKTKQPIPFVNLENFRTKAGTQTNQNGVFSLELPSGKHTDTLKISCVGYLDNSITNLATAEDVIYELTPVVFQLNEVKVRKKKIKEIEIGIINKSGHKWEMINQQVQKPGLQKAVYMKNQSYGIAYLSTLSFFMGDDMFDAPFRIRIYEDNNGFPGTDVLDKSIEFTATKKNSWNTFSISEYNILLSENGLWISVEWIKNEKYIKSASYKFKKSDGSVEVRNFTYYGPELVAHFDTDFGYTYTKSIGSKTWRKERGTTSIGLSKRMRPANIDLLVKSTILIEQ